jgi:peroxiredoxin
MAQCSRFASVELGKGFLGLGSVSARAAFVIDKEGTVQYAEQTETPKDLPNFDAIKEALSKLN